MTTQHDDKTHLSTPQIKALAKAAGGDESLARALLSTRPPEAPKGLCATNFRNETLLVRNPITWVSGTSGSGKTEACFAWLRDAASLGRPTVMMTTAASESARWAPEDVLVLRASDDADLVAHEVKAARRPHTLIITESRLRRHEAETTVRLLMNVLDALPLSGLLVVDELDWRLVSHRNMILTTKKRHLVCLTQTDEDVEHLRKPEDAFFGMHSPNPKRGFVRKGLREGEAVYETQDGDVEVTLAYAGRLLGRPLLSEAERAVVARLEMNRDALRKVTHTERLEAVTRACGYRSWHAAQGRSER